MASHDLQWPCDIDLFRDSAFAQNILDGRFPADAYYTGEQNWYNPFGAAVIGGIAWVLALAPAQVYARHGAVIALAIPLAIFALAVRLFGRWPGLACLFAFLFLGPNDISGWAAPFYSPWLFANLISLVPFALTLVVALHARESPGLRLWALCGILLGVTFLAHTATAVVAGCVVLALGWESRKPRAILSRWLLVLLTALIVSAPLLVSIGWHYGLRIKHPGPLSFIWTENELLRLPDFLKGALNFKNAAALSGLVMLLKNPRMAVPRLTLIPWLIVCVLMLAYGYARQYWAGANLPGVVPMFHWLFHLRLAGAVLAGYGIYCGVVALVSHLARGRNVSGLVAVPTALLILLIFYHGRFTKRPDFREARAAALQYSATPTFTEISNWLRRATPRNAVILARPLDALVLVGSSGRRTVAVEQAFSNPYVAYAPRAAAVAEMYNSLARHEGGAFLQMAAKYHVSHILLTSETTEFADRCLSAPFVTKAFSQGDHAVLRVLRDDERR